MEREQNKLMKTILYSNGNKYAVLIEPLNEGDITKAQVIQVDERLYKILECVQLNDTPVTNPIPTLEANTEPKK